MSDRERASTGWLHRKQRPLKHECGVPDMILYEVKAGDVYECDCGQRFVCKWHTPSGTGRSYKTWLRQSVAKKSWWWPW